MKHAIESVRKDLSEVMNQLDTLREMGGEWKSVITFARANVRAADYALSRIGVDTPDEICIDAEME